MHFSRDGKLIPFAKLTLCGAAECRGWSISEMQKSRDFPISAHGFFCEEFDVRVCSGIKRTNVVGNTIRSLTTCSLQQSGHSPPSSPTWKSLSTDKIWTIKDYTIGFKTSTISLVHLWTNSQQTYLCVHNRFHEESLIRPKSIRRGIRVLSDLQTPWLAISYGVMTEE